MPTVIGNVIVPDVCATVEELLALAGKLELGNAILISEREDGSVLQLCTQMTVSQANYTVDKMKLILLSVTPGK